MLPPPSFSALRTWTCDDQVRSRAEHELELKEKLRAKYVARGRLLEEKDLEILRLSSAKLAEEKEAEAAEDQTSLCLTLVCLSRVHPGCAKVSSLRAGFQDFKEKKIADSVMEEQVNIVAGPGADINVWTELEARKKVGLSDYGMHLATPPMFKISPEDQREHFWVTPWSCVLTLAMREGLEWQPHAIINRQGLRPYEDELEIPLCDLLKSKKDAGMDEVLDCFLLDGPHAGLPEAAYLTVRCI
ncbi:hypothetical protein Tco_0103931 [Tanacetum coccineum]